MRNTHVTEKTPKKEPKKAGRRSPNEGSIDQHDACGAFGHGPDTAQTRLRHGDLIRLIRFFRSDVPITEHWSYAMKGSIQKRQGPQGVAYMARVEFSPDPITGERRQRAKTFRTRKEAQRALSEWLVEIDRGTALDPSTATIGDVLDRWLDAVAKHSVRATTLEDYRSTVTRHLRPEFGNTLIQKLTGERIESFYARKRDEGAGARTVELCHRRLSQALKQAIRWKLIAVNPCDSIKPPRALSKRPDVWSVTELNRFLTIADEDAYSPLWFMAASTGLRLGEVLGLRWRDVELAASSIHVAQAQTLLQGRIQFQEPKTPAARRKVRITPDLIEALKEHRKAQLAERLRSPGWNDLDLVFTTEHGTPIYPSSISRAFNRLTARADLRRIRFHDLRHTHATHLLQAGQPVKVVSERLGHASISITLDTYAHVLPDMQDHAVESITKMLDFKRA